MMIDFNKLYAFFYSFIRYYDDYCLMYVSDVSQLDGEMILVGVVKDTCDKMRVINLENPDVRQ